MHWQLQRHFLGTLIIIHKFFLFHPLLLLAPSLFSFLLVLQALAVLRMLCEELNQVSYSEDRGGFRVLHGGSGSVAARHLEQIATQNEVFSLWVGRQTHEDK